MIRRISFWVRSKDEPEYFARASVSYDRCLLPHDIREGKKANNMELKCKVAICKDIAVLRPYINCKKVRA